MQYVVCYDIGDDRRRARMVRVLKDYGQRIQESVFFAQVEAEACGELLRRAEKELGAEDRLHVIPLCEGCAKKVEMRGQAYLPEDADYYLV